MLVEISQQLSEVHRHARSPLGHPVAELRTKPEYDWVALVAATRATYHTTPVKEVNFQGSCEIAAAG